MFEKKAIKPLPEGYDYYNEVKRKSDKICMKYLTNESELEAEIVKQKLYNLILNLCNQCIYDFVYKFTDDDFNFLIKYNIELSLELREFVSDIIKYKKICGEE